MEKYTSKNNVVKLFESSDIDFDLIDGKVRVTLFDENCHWDGEAFIPIQIFNHIILTYQQILSEQISNMYEGETKV